MTVPAPIECFEDSISRWEGGFQANPNDSGNYVVCNGASRLIGTMRGVTPKTLATHLGVNPCSITVDNIKNISLLDAAQIGLRLFYQRPNFDDLEWSPLVWIAVDIGWGSGPSRGIKMLQKLVGATVDGVIGPQTQSFYAQYIAVGDMGKKCDLLTSMRVAYYERISMPGMKNHVFRNGWIRRASYYTTQSEWWDDWKDWKPRGSQSTAPIEDWADDEFDFEVELEDIYKRLGNILEKM